METPGDCSIRKQDLAAILLPQINANDAAEELEKTNFVKKASFRH